MVYHAFMNQTRFWLAAAIIAVVIIIGFIFSVPPHTKDIPQATSSKEATTTQQVALHDVYKKGTHTFSGNIIVPNACTNVTAEATTTGKVASTTQVTLSLTAPINSEICLQIAQKVKFSTTLIAPRAVSVRVFINNTEASTTRL